MFVPSTPSAPSDLENCPTPAATPRKAAAGIVVTEIATPTPMLARVSTASIPATPAAQRHDDRLRADVLLGGEPDLVDVEFVRQQVEQVEQPRDRRGEDARHAEPHQQRDQPTANQTRAAQDQARAGRGDREQVGRHRHRADDQDLILFDHAKRGDHPGDRHEHEIAHRRPRVQARLPEQVGPDERDRFLRGRRRVDRVEAQQRDVLVRDPQLAEQLERRVGGRGAQVRR